MFHSWVVQCGSHMWLLTTWNVASINEKLNLTIYFILINLYLDLNSYMWLVASLLGNPGGRVPQWERTFFEGQSSVGWCKTSVLQHCHVDEGTLRHMEAATVIAPAQSSLPSPFNTPFHELSWPRWWRCQALLFYWCLFNSRQGPEDIWCSYLSSISFSFLKFLFKILKLCLFNCVTVCAGECSFPKRPEEDTRAPPPPTWL